MIEAASWFFESEVEDGLFAAPGFLWLLLLVPLLGVLMVLMGRLHDRRLRAVFHGQAAEWVRPRGVRVRRTLRDGLLLTALTGGILALAGPRFDKRVRLVEASGVDLVLVVDLSRSMDAEDVDPSRLERARRELFDLVELLEGDRVGMVIFAGGAYARMPLTLDHQALRMLVEEMSTRDFQAQGSAMGEAIRIGTELLTREEGSRAGRALLLVSDGEVHSPTEALEAARAARAAEVRIFALGVGQEPAPIPLGAGHWQEDAAGRRVLSTPNPDFLRELARTGGGAYVDAVPSDRDVRRLYQQEIRGLLQAGVRGARPQVQWRQLWHWPLGLAVLCGLLAGWLGEGHRRWGLAAAVVLAVGLALPRPALAASLAEGDQAYRTGDYPEAVRIFTELAFDAPTDPELLRRLAAARYRAGDHEGAARAWERAAEVSEGPDPDALFNAGNAHARSGRYEEALERYDQVLARDPDHQGAARNRQVVAQELQRRQAEQPPPPPESQDQQGESDEGEEGQQGDPSQPQQGQQQGGPQEGQGEPQEGEDPQGSEEERPEGEQGEQQGEQPAGGGKAEGERDPTDRQESGENETQGSGGRKRTSDSQERVDESEAGEVDPDELDPDAEGDPDAQGGAGGGQPVQTAEEVAAEEARKLLEGVEEGRPRITIPGGSGEKPW
jgi:Ca-activated chloride channel homolog